MLALPTLTDRVRDIMADTFEMDEQEISDHLNQQMTSKWSSLNHLALLVALEEAFAVQFSLHEMAAMTSLPRIVATLQQHAQRSL